MSGLSFKKIKILLLNTQYDVKRITKNVVKWKKKEQLL